MLHKISSIEKIMDKRGVGGGGREYHNFLSKFFCLGAGKISYENPSVLCLRKVLVANNIMDKREGEVSRFSFENFLSDCAEKNGRGTLYSVIFSGIEKFYASEGYVTIFRRKFYVSQYRNISQKNPSMLCFGKFPVAKKFMDKR